MFVELHATQFRPQRRVRQHTVDVEDNTLLCFEAFKDFFYVPCDVEDFEPTEEMMSFWDRPSMARTQEPEISEIEELYREGDANSEVEEDVIPPTTVFKAMQAPKKDPPIASEGFRYDVDAALAASMQNGTMHEWVLV